MDGHPRCECPPTYVRTIPGILKIIELVFTMLTFACAFGGGWWVGGGDGWVQFAGVCSFVGISVWFILHLINVIPQIIVNYLIEFIHYCVMTIILLIAGIVAAACAERAYNRSSVGAASFFAFAAMITCGVDAVFQYLEYRRGTTTTTTNTSTTVTTTSTTMSASKVEY